MQFDREWVARVVREALEEDVGSGDVTSLAVIPAAARAEARIVARERGIVAGLPVAEEVFRQLSPDIHFHSLTTDGSSAQPDARVAELSGPARDVLAGERVALNFLQRMSGIATLTRLCVDLAAGTGVRILDTRKTTPGLRLLEKYAVAMGGGANHRMGLYDQVLIKDNHLRALLPEAGSAPEAVRLAVSRARKGAPTGMIVEVEAEGLEMVEAALEAGADIILLDNMSVAEMRSAAGRVREFREARRSDRPTTEASGGVKPDRLREVAETGVDAVSLGALTHSAPALDLAMEFAWPGRS